jgi:hypothetical protein
VKDEEKKKSAEGFMAILKGEPKENEGDSDEEEAPGADDVFEEKATEIADLLGVEEGKRSRFAELLKSAIYACSEE